ncbi:hypothetical protein FACS1894166_09820 [Bacilli bacterium]|nr:hypothetical protein FACS1894166_09820 [Bacilli bacterium]
MVIDYQNKEQKKALGYDSLFLVLHFFFNEKPEKVTIKNITLDMGGCTIKHNLKGVKIPLIFENVRWFIVPSTNFSQWDIQFINCKKIRTDKLDCSCLYPNLVDMEPENNNY